jgi:nicotinate-nucleotide adenylyltransferase
MKTKIVIFGGTFDPVHLGHIEVAGFAIEHLKAEKLFFVPALRSPFKSERPSSNSDRIDMIKATISENERFAVDDCELNRAEPSYSYDTVMHFRKQFGTEFELFWLLGADMVCDLHKWFRISDIFELCRICIMNRGGYDKPDFGQFEKNMGADAADRLRKDMIETPMIDISSTEIRRRVAQGEDISDMVSLGVKEYIIEKHLYKS